jgi:hypothetical protein
MDVFSRLRKECPALREVLAPKSAWPAIEAAGLGEHSQALHCSCLVLALCRGCLAKVTAPIHRWLLADQTLHPSVRNQYRRDLQEAWLMESDDVRRHERFRGFFGKVVELQIAHWLQDRGWRIDHLEALGASSDIEALSPDLIDCSIQVKYLGQQTQDFTQVVKSIAGENAGGSGSLYGAINYLLFRAYEAAKALQGEPKTRRAIMVVDGLNWHLFDIPLRGSWLDWSKPAFIKTDETDWNEFLSKAQIKYPNLGGELCELLGQLERVWIVRQKSHFEYELEYDIKPAG